MRRVLLVDMSFSGSTSGVDRYIMCLIEGMKLTDKYSLTWLNLKVEEGLFFHDQSLIEEGVYKITIPLPEMMAPILGEKFWADRYFQTAIDIAGRYIDLSKIDIVHLHTLNLYDLAKLLKKQFCCKIITHLHCIPWKSYYNTDMPLFLKLYEQYYIKKDYTTKAYMTNLCEQKAYSKSDAIICVTKCAKNYIQNIMSSEAAPITVVPNGMKIEIEKLPKRDFIDSSNKITLLFVGVLSSSKGIETILKATKILDDRGYNITLNLAGKYDNTTRHKIEARYKDISINILGLLSYEELVKQYKNATIGCIASVQEQASYVAIEMCHYGLPIVTTAIDGLDEMFEHEKSALKVGVVYDPSKGLYASEEEMANSIEQIIKNNNLHNKLSYGSREKFDAEFTVSKMVLRTINVYESVIIKNKKKKKNEQHYI